MDMPSAIFVRLRHQKELYGNTAFTEIAEPLHKAIDKGEEIIAITNRFIHSAGKEILPIVTQSQLKDNRAGTTIGWVQLIVI